MKKILILLYFFISIVIHSQVNNRFTELRGIQDDNGNTHLFYRMGSEENEFNCVYHIDLDYKIDTLLLEAFYFHYSYPTGDIYKRIFDYDFIHKNPSRYVFCGEMCYPDNFGYITFYYETNSERYFHNVTNIEISRQNTNIVYASDDGVLLKTTDGGRNWNEANYNYELISLSPYDDKNLFAINNFKVSASSDGGNIFVDANIKANDKSKFYYDADSTHIYATICQSDYGDAPDLWYLKASNGKPNFYSFKDKYLLEPTFDKIYLSTDQSKSGHLYAALRNRIYKSENYGESFSFFKELDRKIIGIYKKPNSGLLYAMTKYDIFEISEDTIKTIKHIQPQKDLLNWYPLAIGNKWIYNRTILDGTNVSVLYVLREVVGDTLMRNNKKYFTIKTKAKEDIHYDFERVDTSNMQVYRYNAANSCTNYEDVYTDLTLDINDTLRIYCDSKEVGFPLTFYSQNTFNIKGSIFPQRNYGFVMIPWVDFSLAENIGLCRYGHHIFQGLDFSELIGCIISGKVYGDTSFTSVNIENSKIPPINFSLSQNFPNPFNPTTKIKYSIPSYVNHQTSNITLKIYDILGNIVATLVNQEQPAGEYEVEFSAKGGDGYSLSSGIYFYVLNIGDQRLSKKMCLIK